jgi:hypothetical protein
MNCNSSFTFNFLSLRVDKCFFGCILQRYSCFFNFQVQAKNVFSLVKDKKEALFFGVFCVIKRIMEAF